MQDHAPALWRQLIDIGGDDFRRWGHVCVVDLNLFADRMDGQITRLGAMVAYDVKVEVLPFSEDLFPTMPNRAGSLQAGAARVNAFNVIGIEPNLHHRVQVAT